MNAPARPDRDRSTPVTDSPSRRTVLRSGLLIGVGAVGATAVVAGCDSGPSAEQVAAAALAPLASAARSDAAAARALAPRAGEYSAAVRVVADQRAAHAKALADEVARLDRDAARRLDVSTSPSAAPSAGPAGPTSTPGSTGVGSVADLRTALVSAARAAHDGAATSLSGYAAGLAGSVAASATTLAQVQLA